jgi:hypothetical protein
MKQGYGETVAGLPADEMKTRSRSYRHFLITLARLVAEARNREES